MSFASFTQGGLEALGLLAIFVLTTLLPIKRLWRTAILCASTALYLRLHSSELPFLFALFWMEGILATGALFSATWGRLSGGVLFSVRFTLGICVWTLGMLLLSIAHLAFPKLLLVYSALLFLGAFLKIRKKPFIYKAFKYFLHADHVIAISSLYVWVSVLVLRSEERRVG